MAQVVLQDVRKRYANGFEAVKGVDLQIHDQEFVVLVGPSGCGKTTTLRMVAGLEDVSGGTITIGDRVVNRVAPKDRDIAMVFQNYALYPHMTVYKNLAFALKLRRVPKAQIEERVQWAARTLGLSEILDRRPRQLSGGQRQRVAVGRAIVRKPQVFLFDEPLSNLDAKLRVSTRAELKRLQQELKTTTIYVTHDQEEAMTLGDRVVVMNQGIVHQVGTPLDVYRCPLNRFVAGFVGMPPMNFIEGHLRKENGSFCFESEVFQVELTQAQADRISDLSKMPGQVALGVRPESFRLGHPEEPSIADMVVEVVEILGAHMDLFLRAANGRRFVCRTATHDVEVGTTVALTIDMAACHLFEPNEGDSSAPTRWGKNITAP